MRIIITLIILLPFISLYANKSEYIDAFPKTASGMERYVLNLPEQQNESILKVELVIGKNVKIDKDNNYFFTGKIDKEIVKGWGFTYYKLDSLGALAGTLMAENPNSSRVEQFISLGGEPFLIRYNSKIPIVVYVPEGAMVKYRVWSTDLKMEIMNKG